MNEAFAAHAMAVIQDLGLDPSKVNPLGGAIRAATGIHGIRRRNQKYGMVTMCVGAGMGAACIFERM